MPDSDIIAASAYDLTVELARSVLPLLSGIEERDVWLARRLGDALAAVPLWTGDGYLTTDLGREALWSSAARMANEVRDSLMAALDARYIDRAALHQPLELIELAIAALLMTGE